MNTARLTRKPQDGGAANGPSAARTTPANRFGSRKRPLGVKIKIKRRSPSNFSVCLCTATGRLVIESHHVTRVSASLVSSFSQVTRGGTDGNENAVTVLLDCCGEEELNFKELIYQSD